MERRTAASVVAARVASHETILANQQRTLAQLQTEISDKEGRVAALANERTELTQRTETLRSQDQEVWGEINRLGRLIEPAEEGLATLEAERQTMVRELAEHRRQLQQEEQLHQRPRWPYSGPRTR